MKIKFLVISFLFCGSLLDASAFAEKKDAVNTLPGGFAMKKPECKYPQVCKFADECTEKYKKIYPSVQGVDQLTLQGEACLLTVALFVKRLAYKVNFQDQDGNFLTPRMIIDPKTGREKMSLVINRDPEYMKTVRVLQCIDPVLKNSDSTLQDMHAARVRATCVQSYVLAKKSEYAARKVSSETQAVA
jgi:hypothetical protein